jgi:hypothetical protein
VSLLPDTAAFRDGKDENLALQEVKDKVDAIAVSLPTGAEKPVISKLNITAGEPVMHIILESRGPGMDAAAPHPNEQRSGGPPPTPTKKAAPGPPVKMVWIAALRVSPERNSLEGAARRATGGARYFAFVQVPLK